MKHNPAPEDLMLNGARLAVVLPCYRVSKKILPLLEQIGPEVAAVFVIDDCCPEGSGRLVAQQCRDPRVTVLFHERNQGVGGAVLTGYRAALEAGAEVIVKVDGDGQMDPALIPDFVAPILAGEADYTKGNRFFDLEELQEMPRIRLFGNAILSLFSKLSTGYWNIFDPTNGYTAIHADVASHLPHDKLSRRYFFETDMLFRLNTLRAVVVDVPMSARYGDEVSSLRISGIIGEFLYKHLRNTIKRIFYNYYLRDLSLASFELPFGLLLFFGGLVFGVGKWLQSSQTGIATPAGTVMLAALPMIMGLQFLLSFIGHDVAAIPRRPRHTRRFLKPPARAAGVSSPS